MGGREYNAPIMIFKTGNDIFYFDGEYDVYLPISNRVNCLNQQDFTSCETLRNNYISDKTKWSNNLETTALFK